MSFNQIRKSIARTLAPLHHTKGFHFGILINRWESILDKQLANCGKPLRLNGNVLTIQTTHAGALKLSHAQDVIIQAINGYFGKRTVEKIHLITGFVPPYVPKSQMITEITPAVSKVTQCVENTALRAALNDLGKHLK